LTVATKSFAITPGSRRLGGLAAIGISAAIAMGFSGCSAPPTEQGQAAADTGFTGCMVSDFGGLDDKGFNQAVVTGLAEAASSLGINTIPLESSTETDYAPNLGQAIDQDCSLTVTVGFTLADATKEAATANPDVDFAIIDDSSIDLPNVKPVVYDTAQAAFLAGYLAAGFSTTGTVAVYGGQAFPPVMLFMDGYADGVAYYNEAKGAEVKLLGWDKNSQTGTFAGTFVDIAAGKSLSLNFIDQGADVIMPVAGSLYQGTGEAIRDAGTKTVMIGVDNDSFVTAPAYGDLFLSSVVKQMADAVVQVMTEGVNGEFSSEPYVGDLANNGVQLAAFHDFAGKLPAGLEEELTQISQRIIAGDIVVKSANSPR
jgi:basic membrane protein A